MAMALQGRQGLVAGIANAYRTAGHTAGHTVYVDAGVHSLR